MQFLVVLVAVYASLASALPTISEHPESSVLRERQTASLPQAGIRALIH